MVQEASSSTEVGHPTQRGISFGDLKGVIVDFAKAGDVLPMHNHTYDNVHITIVARGSVKVHGPDVPARDVKAGGCVDFVEGHPHEIIALEDGSRCYNIQKHVLPHAQS